MILRKNLWKLYW